MSDNSDNSTNKLDLTFQVPDFQLEEFQKEFAKIEKRGKKLTLNPPKMEITGEEDVQIFPNAENSPFVRMYTIHVTGDKPVLEGWKFLGRIEHDRSGDSHDILCSVPGEEIPEEFRDRGGKCDHCGHKRYRKHTFILENDEGERQQIGSTCVTDFFGGMDVNGALYAFELLDKAEKLAKLKTPDLSKFTDNWKPWRLDIVRYLTLVAAFIREHSWVSRKDARAGYGYRYSTADEAWDFDYRNIRGIDHKYYRTVTPTDADLELAQKTLEHVRGLDVEQCNEYRRNLKSLCSQETVSYRDIGIVGSAIRAYTFDLEKQREDEERANCTSEHVGQIGERLKFQARVDRIIVKRNNPGYYSTLYIYNFVDAQDNKFTWFTGGPICLDQRTKQILAEGDVVEVAGTVKRYNVYRGTKSTILTRCKIQANVRSKVAV